MTGSFRDASIAAELLRGEFPRSGARALRTHHGWCIAVQRGLSRAVLLDGQAARKWLAAHAPAGEAGPGASPAGQGG